MVTYTLDNIIDNERAKIIEYVEGKMVYNGGQARTATPVPFRDQRMQYAFREYTGGVLLEDKSNVAVALFDVFLPTEEWYYDENSLGGDDHGDDEDVDDDDHHYLVCCILFTPV